MAEKKNPEGLFDMNIFQIGKMYVQHNLKTIKRRKSRDNKGTNNA
jgi:hypothetical protein